MRNKLFLPVGITLSLVLLAVAVNTYPRFHLEVLPVSPTRSANS
ncbi:MAG TPA: hypothetical protein VMH27_20860 [Puia sp.]|nr:hypothetical protein [Puia sp.]